MSMTQEQNEKVISMQEMLVLVKRYLFKILAAGLIGGVLTFCVCNFLVAPVYEASAKMIVNAKQEQSGTVTNDQITSAQKLVDTYAIIIHSRTVLEPVIEELDLAMDVEKLAKMVTVTSVNGTQVMQIAVQSTDPEMAVDIVAKIVSTSPDIILDAVEAGSVKTVETAHLKKNPVAPNTNLFTLLTAFLCMFAVMAIVFIRHVMDHTYKSEVELRDDLCLPVLGVIPEYNSCVKNGEGRGYGYGKV